MTLGSASRIIPSVEIITTDDALDGLRDDWDRLLEISNAAGVFLTWDWITAWRGTLGRDHDLRIATGRDPDDGRLVGIAPLAVEPRARAGVRHRALVVAGSGPAAPDHLDLILEPGTEPAVAPVLWDALERDGDWDLLDLDGVTGGGALAAVAARRACDRAKADEIPCPYLELPQSWEEFERRLGKNLRQNLGRYRRKLDREAPGPVTERLVTDAADLDATLADLGDLHQQIRTSKGDTGAFATARLRSFHREVARRFLESGRLRLHRLDVDGRLAAAIVCFRYGDTVSFYTTGYDETWARYGPGRRILARAIASAIAEGATVFDFLRGDEAYKDHWNTEVRADLRIRRPVSTRGRLLFAARAAASMLRR